MKFLAHSIFLLIGFGMSVPFISAHKGTGSAINSSPTSPTSPSSPYGNKITLESLNQKFFFNEIKALVIPKIHVIQPLMCNSNLVAALLTDGSIQIWNWMDSSWIKTIDAGKTSIKNDVYDWFIGSLLELPDGRLLSVVGNLSDGADVKIWDIEENTCLKTCPEKCLWPNPLLVVSENSQIIAFRSDYSSTVLWNIEKNETEILGSGHYVLPLSFIAHRKQGGRSCVYDMETRSFLFKTNTNIANFDTATLLLPNKIAFISDDKKCLIIHDFKNNIVDRFVAHKADISSLTVIRIDENVSLLFSADMNGVLHVWFNGVPSHKKDAINPFYSFVFPYGIKHLDTDGKYLFIVFNDNSIKILRIKNYLEAIEKDFSRLLNII